MFNLYKRAQGIVKAMENNVALVQSVQQKQILLLEENSWANIYHDTIRGKIYIEELSISPGRWAGNYSFFYVLNRILNDVKPKTIIEFGLGESTKVVSAYLDNILLDSHLITIEHNQEWIKNFQDRFLVSERSTIQFCPQTTVQIKGHSVNSYQDFQKYIKVDGLTLVLVDGISSPNYSRYYIYLILELITKNEDFIIIVDDYNRDGEKQTANDIIEFLQKQQIIVYKEAYSGVTAQLIITTSKYHFLTSL